MFIEIMKNVILLHDRKAERTGFLTKYSECDILGKYSYVGEQYSILQHHVEKRGEGFNPIFLLVNLYSHWLQYFVKPAKSLS